MNAKSDITGTVHRPSFADARVAICGAEVGEHETWWGVDLDVDCPECLAVIEEETNEHP